MLGEKSYTNSVAHTIVGDLFPPGHRVSVPLNDKVWLPLNYFISQYQVNSTQERSQHLGLRNSDNQEEIALLL
jgi:hypothetical protein